MARRRDGAAPAEAGPVPAGAPGGGYVSGWLTDDDMMGPPGFGMPPEQYDLQPTSSKYRGSP